MAEEAQLTSRSSSVASVAGSEAELSGMGREEDDPPTPPPHIGEFRRFAATGRPARKAKPRRKKTAFKAGCGRCLQKRAPEARAQFLSRHCGRCHRTFGSAGRLLHHRRYAAARHGQRRRGCPASAAPPTAKAAKETEGPSMAGEAGESGETAFPRAFGCGECGELRTPSAEAMAAHFVDCAPAELLKGLLAALLPRAPERFASRGLFAGWACPTCHDFRSNSKAKLRRHLATCRKAVGEAGKAAELVPETAQSSSEPSVREPAPQPAEEESVLMEGAEKPLVTLDATAAEEVDIASEDEGAEEEKGGQADASEPLDAPEPSRGTRMSSQAASEHSGESAGAAEPQNRSLPSSDVSDRRCVECGKVFRAPSNLRRHLGRANRCAALRGKGRGNEQLRAQFEKPRERSAEGDDEATKEPEDVAGQGEAEAEAEVASEESDGEDEPEAEADKGDNNDDKDPQGSSNTLSLVSEEDPQGTKTCPSCRHIFDRPYKLRRHMATGTCSHVQGDGPTTQQAAAEPDESTAGKDDAGGAEETLVDEALAEESMADETNGEADGSGEGDAADLSEEEVEEEPAPTAEQSTLVSERDPNGNKTCAHCRHIFNRPSKLQKHLPVCSVRKAEEQAGAEEDEESSNKTAEESAQIEPSAVALMEEEAEEEEQPSPAKPSPDQAEPLDNKTCPGCQRQFNRPAKLRSHMGPSGVCSLAPSQASHGRAPAVPTLVQLKTDGAEAEEEEDEPLSDSEAGDEQPPSLDTAEGPTDPAAEAEDTAATKGTSQPPPDDKTCVDCGHTFPHPNKLKRHLGVQGVCAVLRGVGKLAADHRAAMGKVMGGTVASRLDQTVGPSVHEAMREEEEAEEDAESESEADQTDALEEAREGGDESGATAPQEEEAESAGGPRATLPQALPDRTCKDCRRSFACPSKLVQHLGAAGVCAVKRGYVKPVAEPANTPPQEGPQQPKPSLTQVKEPEPLPEAGKADEDELKCPQCGKEFTARSKLAIHVGEAGGPCASLRSTCPGCGKPFSGPAKLARHRARGPPQCQVEEAKAPSPMETSEAATTADKRTKRDASDAEAGVAKKRRVSFDPEEGVGSSSKRPSVAERFAKPAASGKAQPIQPKPPVLAAGAKAVSKPATRASAKPAAGTNDSLARGMVDSVKACLFCPYQSLKSVGPLLRHIHQRLGCRVETLLRNSPPNDGCPARCGVLGGGVPIIRAHLLSGQGRACAVKLFGEIEEHRCGSCGAAFDRSVKLQRHKRTLDSCKLAAPLTPRI